MTQSRCWHQCLQAERAGSEQGGSWGGSPLTDSASPRLDHSDSPEASCVYEQLHAAASGRRAHAQAPSCQRGRCEAGRYFLGAPPSGREAWWGGARPLLSLTRSSMEKHEGCPRNLTQVTAAHGCHGETRLRASVWGLMSEVKSSFGCPAGGGRWDEDSTVGSPDGGSASDSGYHCSPQEPGRTQPLAGAPQQAVKEEEGRLHLQASVAVAPAGPAEGLPRVSTPRFTSEYCPASRAQPPPCPGLGQLTGPAPSPLPVSRLSSPGSEHLHKPKAPRRTDLPPLSLPLQHPLVRPAACAMSPSPASVLCPSHSYPRPYLDKHAAYSLTGYALEHLCDPENLRGHCTSATNGPTHYDISPHLRVATEQSPGHKGPSVIITNGS